jgi:thioredoxin reductase (NADPH)
LFPRGSRHEENFPTLTPKEIERLRGYGTPHAFADGEKLVEAGKRLPGAFVLISGLIAITERDGLGHAAAFAEQGAGQFLGEIGLLSDGASLVDATAEGEVEALLIPPARLRSFLVADVNLGERIMRALILRRVALLERRAGRVVLIGSATAPLSSVCRSFSPGTTIRNICSTRRRIRRRAKWPVTQISREACHWLLARTERCSPTRLKLRSRAKSD